MELSIFTYAVYAASLFLIILGIRRCVKGFPYRRFRNRLEAAGAGLSEKLRICRKNFSAEGSGMISKALRKQEQEKMDGEIYEDISFLRNLTVMGPGRQAGADYMIEQLSLRRGRLQAIYGRMLHLLRQNQRGEAVQYFSAKVGTPISGDFARLLVQWDDIDPRELLETLLSHQKNIKEVRITTQKRRDEMISDLIYLPAVLNVMLIFINFIYVAYFIDQRDLLTMFF
ncbi:MAG: hypothetical protein E7224_03705 [Clostridiales bacterium]|nr:hypothetical protein [Clostridiales bacterium]